MKNSNKTPSEERFELIEQRLVEIISDFGYLKGRSPKIAQITAYIYIREEVTQQLLRQLTGYSLGTVSAALQELEQLGVVTKQASSDARGYVYRLAGTPLQVLSRSMADVKEYLSLTSGFLEEVEAKLSKKALSTRQGYSTLRRFFDEMNGLIPAYERVLQKFQAPPIATGKKQEDATNEK